MTTWLVPGRAWVSTHEYLHTITLVVLMRITGDFLFVDLRKVLNSLYTSRFLLVSCRYSIRIHETTKSRIICLTKTEGLLPSNSQFFNEKDTTKDSEARQLIKPWPTRTILNQNEPKLLFVQGDPPENIVLPPPCLFDLHLIHFKIIL